MDSTELFDVLESGCNNKGTFQKGIRDYINGWDDLQSAAEAVAKVVGDWKRWRERQISRAALTKEETILERKKVNNIINDVARICRDMTGLTIKNVSRKNHTYEATEPTPRNTTPATKGSVTINDLVENESLVDVMVALIDKHGEDDFLEAARSAVEEIKRRRGDVETDN